MSSAQKKFISSYEIDASLTRFGRLKPDVVTGADRCYQLLHGLDRPCSDCPLLRDVNEPWPRTTVRAMADDAVEVIRATPSDPSHSAVTLEVVRLNCETLKLIRSTRISSVAARANLTSREQAIFTRLLDGESFETIADELGLSPRTVKFHQANILQKTGAASRADLCRLIK